MNIKNIIVSLVFILFLSMVSIVNIITPQKSFSESENRYLALFPKFNLENIYNGKFNSEFEKYASDQFLGRDYFIGVNVLSEILLGKKDSNGVYFGDDGYLLEKVDENSIDKERLEKNINLLNEFFDSLRENENIESMNAMIVPTAPYILSYKLPNYAQQYNQQYILKMLEENLGENFINLYSSLDQHKDEYIYYKTDHHWTTYGAFIAYKEYCIKNGLEIPNIKDYKIEEVSNEFLGTIYSKVQIPNIEKDIMYKFVEDNDFSITYNYDEESDSLYKDDYLEKRDKYAYYLNGNNAITEIKTNVNNSKHILVIKDSFAHCFTPFLTENFEKITMIDYRYFNASTKELIESEGITDVLVMYNTINFAGDRDFYNIVR